MEWRGKTTWMVGLGFLLWWLFNYESHQPNNLTWGGRTPIDFYIYYLAGQDIAQGHNLYDGAILKGLPFTYPPFSGALFSLFSRWPVETAAILWQLLSFLALIAVIFAVMAERKIKITAPVAFVAVGLAFASITLDAVKGTFVFGQINLFLMLLVAMDLLPVKRPWAGVGVGLAAGVKLTPAFMGLNFLVERNWRAAVVSVCTFLITVAIGFSFVPDAKKFWTEAIFDSERVGVEENTGAQAIKAVLFREFGEVQGWLWLTLVAVVFIFCVLGLIRSLGLGNKSFAMVLSGITAALVSPFSWFHHWVWLVPLGVCIACFFNEKFEAFRLRKQWNGFGGWIYSQLGALIAMAVLTAVMIPFLSRPLTDYLGYNHPVQSPYWWWRESFLYTGALLVVGYGLFALVMMIKNRRILPVRKSEEYPADSERSDLVDTSTNSGVQHAALPATGASRLRH